MSRSSARAGAASGRLPFVSRREFEQANLGAETVVIALMTKLGDLGPNVVTPVTLTPEELREAGKRQLHFEEQADGRKLLTTSRRR